MTKQILELITSLTEINNHTEARLEVARNYDYLARFVQAFQAIKEIHLLEGYLPYGIMLYGDEKTNEMLKQIEKTEGKKELNLINSIL